ncbi:MAG TPA: type II secretion system F family protein [Syntrophorhabdales bacterium]|nr:type II secretion system F family protein [Syntrophorhabdales bacterium]
MPVFSYTATTMEGSIVEGVVEAPEEKSAVEKLKSTGVIPLKLAAPKEEGAGRLWRKSAKGGLLTFTTEMSALLSAGLPLDRSLNILSDISESREMKSVIQSILKSIREGSAFSDALQRHPKIFSKLYVSMIRAGEVGGALDVVLDKLGEFLETSKELKDHVVSAMIYPTILVLTGGASIIVMLTFVLPRFSVIFSELGSALPLPTQILLAVSNALKSYWWIVLLIVMGGWFPIRSYVRSEAGRYRWDALKLRMVGDVTRRLETARFCRTLGTLIKSGVPLLQALTNAKEVLGNQVIASAIDKVAKGTKEGKGIAVPLSEAHVFPPLALSMIKVGEETGQLDTMLLKVATTYEKSLREALKRFMSLLEPLMILIMALIIGFIVISMLLGVYSIMDLPV